MLARPMRRISRSWETITPSWLFPELRRESLIGLGDYDGAITSLSRAYELRKSHKAPRAILHGRRGCLAGALVESGTDTARGRQLVDHARLTLSGLGASAQSEVADIDNWLAGQPWHGLTTLH